MSWLKVVFLLIPLFAYSQEAAFKRYSAENGLASSAVYSLYFDSRQFLWISTEAGVSRFDGTAFINYTTENGLTDNEIIEICEDPKGRIWFAGYNGTLCYLYNDTIFPFYENKREKKLLHAGIVTGFLNDAAGNLWLWGEKLVKISDGGYEIVNIPLHGSQKIAYAASLENNMLLVVADRYIYHLSAGKIIQQTDVTASIKTFARGILRYDKGYIIYSKHEIIYGLLSGNKFISLKKISPDAEINTIIPGKDDKGLWISTYNKGLLYYPDIFNSPAAETYLANRSIGKTAWDAEGGMWAAINGDALYYFVNTRAYYYDSYLPDELQNSFSVTGDKSGNIYAGLINGSILTIDRENKTSVKSSPLLERGYNRVKDIMPLNGDLWIGTDFGLFRLNPAGAINEINNFGAIKSIAKSKDGNVLVGSYDAAHIIYPGDNFRARKIFNRRTTAICSDDSGNIYMGTLDGVFLYNIKSEKIYPFSYKELSGKSITGLQYSLGALWVGTNKKGLIAFFDNSRTVIFDKKAGLASNICKSVYADDKGAIWVGTSNGLSSILKSGDKFEIKNYSQVDGLKSLQVNDVFVQNDSAWVATSAGLTLLPGNEKTAKKIHTPPIYINKAATAGSHLGISNGAALSYANNSLVFSFIGISFKSAGKMTYKYRLKGLDNVWKYTTNTQVEYASIPPGAYSFEVFACDYFGACSVAPAVFTFSINTPFWKTTWFFILSATCFVIIIIFIFRKIKKNEARKNYLQRKMIQLELEAVKAQLNPHFIFNSLNSIQYFINSNDYENSQAFLTRFARLVRNTLEYSSKSFIKLDEEVKYLDDYLALEKMRLNDRFDYNITVNVSRPSKHIYVPPMLNQIYVENAVRHGIRPLKQVKGILNINFSDSADSLVCTIEDNGIGRLAASQMKENRVDGHTSRGMEINRHRIDILNSVNEKDIVFEVIDKTEETYGETGTIIRITMPLAFNNVLL